jgi:hypothetical protein
MSAPPIAEVAARTLTTGWGDPDRSPKHANREFLADAHCGERRIKENYGPPGLMRGARAKELALLARG